MPRIARRSGKHASTMSTDRIKRVNELLRREISSALFRVLGTERAVDVSAITVTHVETSRDLRQARVFVSIREHEEDRSLIMNRLRRHRGELQESINRNLKMKYTPRVVFVFDPSIAKGDRVLGILAEMEAEAGEETDHDACDSQTTG